MVKKSKKKGGPRPKPQRDAAPNMFERLSNKKRFDVLGRKTKGDVRSINKLRSAATEKRKSTLLVEYRQLRKSNAFIDRRFGEDDDTLTADERALLRFQKQRMRDMAGSKFTLGDDDGGDAGEPAQLTHLGRSLAEVDDFGGGWGSDDDAGGDLDDQMTRELHFGGGFVPSKVQRDVDDGDGDGGAPHRKSKKEVMEEIIAKSKMHKALKSQQREEDVAATDALDAAFTALTQGGALAGLVRPKGEKPDVKSIAQDEDDKKFDVMTRELVFEAKAAPGERTLTAEELAELERARLEELERQRVKRQRGEGEAGGDDLGDDFGGDSGGEEEAVPAGGYAARRAKRARKEAERAARDAEREGDSDEDDSGDSDGSEGNESESDDDDGLTALERRRRDRAAGDHPLQEAFRGVAAKLLAKHGLELPEELSDLEEEEGDDDGSGSESEDEESGSDEEGSESGGESEEEEEVGASEESAEEEEAPAPAAVAAKAGKVKAKASVAAAAGTLTFTPALPSDYTEFAAAAAGLSAEDLGELLRRMRGFNAAALATEGRKRTQVLYGCLVQHYVSLAGAPAGPALDHLDALLPHIMELTPQVPFYAATLARARLERAQSTLVARLKDPLLKAQAWPGIKLLLLLKLYAVVYPVSDKRHPVLTPAGLLATAALALCPLTRPHDVATGLFLAALAAHMHAEAKRYCPEPLQFAVTLLHDSFTPLAAPAPHKSAPQQRDEDGPTPRWLALNAAELATAPKKEADIEGLSISRVFGPEGDAATAGYLGSAAFKSAAAAAAVRLIGRTAATLTDLDALPEAMGPALEALRAVVAVGSAAAAPAANGTAKKSGKKAKGHPINGVHGICVAPGVAALAARVLAEVEAAVAAVAGRRRPLVNPALAAVPETKQYNPRFEDNFASGKDYDPDRERAERRRLQRELRREERGAARELRRDAAFMAGVRDREKSSLQADLDATARRAKAFLQQQAADAKSGGQGGMWKKKKSK